MQKHIHYVSRQSHTFRQFAEFFPPGITTVHFCDHVFRTLDTDGNGFLDFKVWNKYLSEKIYEFENFTSV